MSSTFTRILRFVPAAAIFIAGHLGAAPAKQILLVLTNHSQLGDSGKTTGFFLSEASHPWEVFKKAGYTVTLASPDGGFAPVDIRSHDLKDPANKAFWELFGTGLPEKGNLGVPNTVSLSQVSAADYAGVFYAGGHGTMWDFRNNKDVAKVTASIYENGGVVGAVCHGPAALIDVKLSDGTSLVSGKEMAAFTNKEEAAVKLDKVVPYALQTELEKAGAKIELGENFKEKAVRDGRLVTGQNPSSAKKAAELMVDALK